MQLRKKAQTGSPSCQLKKSKFDKFILHISSERLSPTDVVIIQVSVAMSLCVYYLSRSRMRLPRSGKNITCETFALLPKISTPRNSYLNWPPT
uniref:Uncharacterized protein n=1 Tax=Arundo donax TaxID=35708 RepID=A0A0A8YNN9_ARUDO